MALKRARLIQLRDMMKRVARRKIPNYDIRGIRPDPECGTAGCVFGHAAVEFDLKARRSGGTVPTVARWLGARGDHGYCAPEMEHIWNPACYTEQDQCNPHAAIRHINNVLLGRPLVP